MDTEGPNKPRYNTKDKQTKTSFTHYFYPNSKGYASDTAKNKKMLKQGLLCSSPWLKSNSQGVQAESIPLGILAEN